jgi:hypothetical protein
MHKDKMKIIYQHGEMDVKTVLAKCQGNEGDAHQIIETAIRRFIESEIKITINTLQSLGESIRGLALSLEELRKTLKQDPKQQLELYELRSWLTRNEVKEWQRFIAQQEAKPIPNNPFEGTNVPF